MSALDEKLTGEILPVLDLPPSVREYYNTLRDRILLSVDEKIAALGLIGVTSGYAGEGVSTVAANLAVALSHQGSSLLVDANIQNPAVHRIFSVNLAPGLADALESGKTGLASTAARDLDVIPAGHTNGTVPQLYESSAGLEGFLTRVRGKYRFVVFDLPPVSETSAALRLARLVDGVILVVEAERSRWQSVQRFRDQLLQVKANLLGIVLNKRRFPVPRFLYRS